MNFSTNQLNIERITLKISPESKPSTWKPGINRAAINTIRPLIINKNKPSVKNVIGMVNKTSNGLTKVFSNPNPMATINAVLKFSNGVPESKVVPGR